MAFRPLTLRCKDGRHLASVGLDPERRVVMAGARTENYSPGKDLTDYEVRVLEAAGRLKPSRARGAFDGVVSDEATFVPLGCDCHPGLSVEVDDLRAWVVEAARGGQKVRIVGAS